MTTGTPSRTVAYDEDLADRIRAVLGGQPFAEKQMFGGLAFLVDGHLAVAAGGRGGLMLRVDPQDVEALLREPGTDVVQMGARGPMKGWLHVDGDAVRDAAALATWVRRALVCTAALPPKAPRRPL